MAHLVHCGGQWINVGAGGRLGSSGLTCAVGCLLCACQCQIVNYVDIWLTVCGILQDMVGGWVVAAPHMVGVNWVCVNTIGT